ncbi:copper homeostasis protein CutC [uncultured Clostridium sp.]|uniref:copper homeostasis protein CutC n=1 Tax=uncultured Clostridium sp. TaxID=59620 RepID=UPI002621B050|nr:copper homeostasis protein CutC [uncultured Clostridium sp.]
MKRVFEVCTGSYNDAVLADIKGADRIELCDNLLEDGTTPSYGTIKRTILDVKADIMIIIRPRGGEFEFSKEEELIMIEDIKIAKELNAYGVVIGALKDKEIDYEMVKILVNVAKPMSTTFHMAFDEIEDKKKAIDFLVEIGVDRILTKGGNTNAYDAMESLKELNDYADGRISIMPGKSVTTENRDEILMKTGTFEIHGSKVI